MGLPSKRRTKTSRKDRASHFALKKTALTKCTKCGKPVLPHRACVVCGTYKGREIIKIKTRAKTLRKRDQARKEAAKVKEAEKESKKAKK